LTQTRVRFAPSPTGDLHMGGARTALFNWLFARHTNGTFILRIEDTDRERSTEEATQGILQGLQWLGIGWDEGPFYQSKRTELYNNAVNTLLENGAAYYDFSDPDKISADREAAKASGKQYMYDRHGMEADLVNARTRIANGEKAAVRLLVPPGETRFTDIVAGEISFRNEKIEDFVLARNDGSPTYMLSVVVDDADLGITHVIRGNDHIANTPKQILIYKALKATVPQFAHLPLIHGPDKKKLSKRHGGTTVGEYTGIGYLPLALINFLALLGWNPGVDQELFTSEELIQAFSLDRVNNSPAIFDVEKLNWINSKIISASDNKDLITWLKPELEKLGLWQDSYLLEKADWLNQVIDLIKERARLTTDLASDALYFFRAPSTYDEKAVRKRCKGEELPGQIQSLAAELATVESWTSEAIESTLRSLAESMQINAATLIHPLRIGVTGMGVSPDIFTICQLLQKEPVCERLAAFSSFLSSR
jgi:glutamyl-tRNA synthetase